MAVTRSVHQSRREIEIERSEYPDSRRKPDDRWLTCQRLHAARKVGKLIAT